MTSLITPHESASTLAAMRAVAPGLDWDWQSSRALAGVARCPVCGRLVLDNGDGTPARHTDPDGRICSGGGR